MPSLKVTVESAVFDAMRDLIENINKQYGIQIHTVNVDWDTKKLSIDSSTNTFYSSQL